MAIVATARKLACLFWCLLTREENYAYAQPSLTRKKLRRLEITAGAPKGKGSCEPGVWSVNDAMRKAERELASQGERAYARSVRDWQAQRKQKRGAGATAERASSGSSSDQAARQGSAPEPAL